MIKSWKHKGIRKFYLSGYRSGIIVNHAKRLQVIFQLLDAANSPGKMNLPGFNFHKLQGELKHFYAVTVRANWRIIFQFDGEDAVLVDYIDYH
jgi:proteic killer suppression protein